MLNFKYYVGQSILGIVIILACISCRQDPAVTEKQSVDQIVVRMFDEPETLSPILAVTSLARECFQYLFLNLADYDYQTLELKPVLIDKIPESTTITDGPYKGSIAFRMKIRDEAVWTNGSPVDANDVLFTFKIAAHPSVHSPGWKSLLKDIVHIEINPDDAKIFTVYATDNNFRNKEIILSVEIYPRHIFDPGNVLGKISLADLIDEAKHEQLLKDESFKNLGTDFSSIKYSKELAEGAGPYQLESWEYGQYLVLKKKEDYWGERITDIDQLETYPNRIVLQFLKDEATALTLLKNSELDIVDLSKSSFKQFDDLKADPGFSLHYNFQTTQLPRYYFLQLNNEDIRMSDIQVRKAISHLIDVDRMIRQIEGGYAKRVNSMIHFSKPEYNRNLEFTEYNPELAISILNKAGWIDKDGDGVREKELNGRIETLSLRLHISGSSLSSSVAAIIKDGCQPAGIEIDIINKPNSAIRTENLIPGDFELFITQQTQSPVRDDPYITFHSSSIGAAGLNYMRYSSSEADKLIETIRGTKDESIRNNAYQNFQKLINDEIPVVFLYSPQLRIVANNQFQPVISSKRPGFFVNAQEIIQ